MSEVETLREPPPNPPANNAARDATQEAGRDATLRTRDTINGEMIRQVIEKVSKDAGYWNLLEIGQLFKTRPQKN